LPALVNEADEPQFKGGAGTPQKIARLGGKYTPPRPEVCAPIVTRKIRTREKRECHRRKKQGEPFAPVSDSGARWVGGCAVGGIAERKHRGD